jgi:hypothetical protein
MKKLAWLIALFITGCASLETPAWRLASFSHLESYKNHLLTGNQGLAELQFRRAIEEINKSGDLDVLARAFLTRQALHIALLTTYPQDDYLAVERLHLVPANRNYFLFLEGSFLQVEAALLPSQYRELLPALQKKEPRAILAAIGKIEDPLSRLIATGLAVRLGLDEERLLLAAIDNASAQGWKGALLVYLEATRKYYERKSAGDKAGRMQDIIDLITKERPRAIN